MFFCRIRRNIFPEMSYLSKALFQKQNLRLTIKRTEENHEKTNAIATSYIIRRDH